MKENKSRDDISAFLQQASTQSQVDVQRDLQSLLQIVKAAPDAYLILSPDLKIQLVTDAYLKATLSEQDDLLGKYMFEAFPDNPATPDAKSVKHLHNSLKRVLETRKPHQMAVQHYDVPRPAHLGGGFEEKHWSPLNTPVLNEAGEVSFIIHKVTDITELVRSQENVQELRDKQHILQATFDQLRKTQQKMEEEQKRLEEAQALGHIGSFEALFPYEDIHWSDELYRIYGLEPQSEKITFEKYATFIHPDDKELHDVALADFYEEHEKLDFVHSIIQKDGATRVLHVHAEIISDARVGDGGSKVYGTVQDITEQVKAQQKLRDSERLLREAEEVGQIGSYYGDIRTGTFRFSEGMSHLLGLTPEEKVLTLDIIDASSHPDDAPVVRRILERAIQNKQSYEYERRVYRPDGQMRYLHSKGKVACDGQGNAVKLLGIVQDVTEQKRAEAELRQSELHFRTLVSNTPDAVTRWDKDLALVFTNYAFEAKTGLPVSSLYLQGHPSPEQPESSTLSWRDKMKLVFETGAAQDHYHYYAMPGGTAHYHSRLVPEFYEKDTVQSVLVLARDISALKKLEEENLSLRLSQQKELLLAIMETQETERTRIAEGLHNGVGQLLYGAKLHLDQLNREEASKDLLKFKTAVLRTEQMLDEAINQTRTLSHQLTPSVLEHFGLDVAFKEICATFRSESLDFQCLTFNLHSELEKHLQVAVYRFAQELASNIIKHAAATEASLLLREQKGTLVLLSEDNGKGFVPEQVRAKGIGLKSIQDRVKLLNGTMRLHSAPGNGTLVQISLPITT